MTEDGRRRGCLRSSALGCGALVLLGLLLIFGGMGVVFVQSRRAVSLREQLERTLPTVEQFTPDPGGALAADRVTRFLAVRAALMPACDDFTAFAEGMAGLEAEARRMDALGEDELGGRELLGFLGRTTSVMGSMFSLGSDLADYAATRNRTLLEQGMGLGEYTFIYVVAYHGWLGHEPRPFLVEERGAPARVFHGRVRGAVRAMIARHVAAREALAAAGETRDAAGLQGAADLDAWRAELAALDVDASRRPFQDGLPPALLASLEPFRDELERLHCPATGELDLMRTRQQGLSFDHR